jgi:hypothetical protein
MQVKATQVDAKPSEQNPQPAPAPGAAHGHGSTGQRPLSPAAERALAEAAARRVERERKAGEQPKEVAGRGGLEPTRYGDWEISGIASDF